MKLTKRALLQSTSGLFASTVTGAMASNASAQDATSKKPGLAEIANGPFKPTWDSLIEGYKPPDWFRDAKFGLWAHWGAQCVPEDGDWYARHMYIQGTKQYDFHVKTYGHPADNGFIEMYPRWTAENFNPDDLLDLYKAAGAKYFVAMANHHDNFDAYDSKFHDWNSVKIGPKTDIVGRFAKAARDRGLKFGVSNHAAHAWHWFQTAYGYDPEGPRKGERYDAFRLTKYDGKGKWWDGLDPQALYGGAVMPLPDGINTIKDADDWHEKHDRVWDEKPPLHNPAFVRQWYLRCKDLVDSYKPDLLYFDNFDLPLGQAGLDIAAHYYNASMQWHGGKLEAVINTKHLPAERRMAVIEDVERGLRKDIEPHPWQTDTCIGDWHYNRRRLERKNYLGAQTVIHRLCDIVSKNGNLLLSIPVRGDGTIDSEERHIVEEIGGWMNRFGDAIYGTRPWKIYGEGPTVVEAGMFSEGKQKPFTPADIRFTTKGGALYVMTLGKPASETVTIAALSKANVARVEVVGTKALLKFKRDTSGLHITLPAGASHDFGVALKITGRGIV